MEHDSHVWLPKLESHRKKHRAARPIPDRNSLSHSQGMQFHIIKGALLLQLNNLSAMISSRKGIGQSGPSIIFTSYDAGLAAANEIEQEKKFPILSLYPEELGSFLQLFPDTGYKRHVHIWSHFLVEEKSQTSMYAQRFPLKDMAKYWLHVEGIMCGPLLGRGTEHLWSWDGIRPKLLKKNFRHWAS